MSANKRNEFETRRVDTLRLIKLKENIKKMRGKHLINTVAGFKGDNLYEADLQMDEEYKFHPGLTSDEYMKLFRQKIDVRMDQLVNRLKLMDFRDFLAINKYIIEERDAKKYHAFARAQVLAAAMRR